MINLAKSAKEKSVDVGEENIPYPVSLLVHTKEAIEKRISQLSFLQEPSTISCDAGHLVPVLSVRSGHTARLRHCRRVRRERGATSET